MIEIGKKAPAWTLPDQSGNSIRLSDYKDHWLVLYFYPKDDTPGCTVEACEFTEAIKGFEKLNAKVFGCSPDQPERHQKFIEKYKLRIHLLSDPSHKVMEKYGAWGEKNMYGKISEGVIRSTVIIDPNLKIAHHWKRVRSKGHAEHVYKRLVELQKSS